MQNQINIWVEQSRLGNREAFAQIVRQFQAKVSAVTFSITGNLQESEDIAQETFLVAWKQIGELQAPEKIGVWLCGIARILCKNQFRRKQHDPLCAAENAELPQLASPEAEPETAERKELARLAWSSIANIPEQFREPLILYYREGQSVREVAETLELTETSVKQRLYRGRQHLKEEVERLIENALTKTRPGEFFTVAVLAAIPVLTTGKQALAAGSAGAVAAQSSPNTPLLALIGTHFWKFLFSLAPVLLAFAGTVLGVWSGIRNAPTLSARRFMIRITLEYFLFASVFFSTHVLFMLFLQSWRPFFEYTLYSLLIAVPVTVFFNSIRINRMWRKIVETDAAATGEGKLFYLLLTGGLLCYAMGVGLIIVITHLPLVPLIVFLTIPVAAILFLWCALRISKDEAAFQKLPPRLPNLLSILTGEQKPPRGLRNRINLVGDLVAAGMGLNMTFFYVGWYLRNHYGSEQFTFFDMPFITGNELATSVLVLTIAAYIVFALFFAGIPRKRYWGMVFLGSSVLLLDTLAILVAFTPFWNSHNEWKTVTGIVAWYLVWYVLHGVAGLRVFKSKG
ncbi:hypothetical protein FACS189419_03020 [Planctomycetales bacterium]|nr:hypothetical protein FACS189419_03020 [Planctomycetales bacterium]